jgi:O-antigen ligase
MTIDRRRRPLGAVVSQAIVASSSFVLSLIALRELGVTGLGRFSLLFGILITLNSVQTGWIGDSLTVLDRFDPGIRRALIRSQWIAVAAIAAIAFALAVGSLGATTAALFAAAGVAWAIEDTLRRILIARREFWALTLNDAGFGVGALGLLGLVAASRNDITLDAMIASLVAGAVVAIGMAVVQLPRVELERGPAAPMRMREVASFAGWRSVQVGLRPASLAVVRVVVAATASLAALGQLEAARLVIAPILTLVGGAGVYLLPTYADQARRGVSLRPRLRDAMVIVGAIAVVYGVVALAGRQVIVEALTGGTAEVTTTAVAGWLAFALAFGLGLPAGSAMVALGRSRRTFTIRAIDAFVGVAVASLLAVAGAVQAVPFGLALGAFVGVALLVRALAEHPPSITTDVPDVPDPPPPPSPARWRWMPEAAVPPALERSVPPPPTAPSQRGPTANARASARRSARRGAARRDAPRELLWIAPLLLIVFTEYKVRRRSIDDLLTGSIDPMIAAELVVYGVVGSWAVIRLIGAHRAADRLAPVIVVMWGYILTTAASALYSTLPTLALARGVQLVVIGVVVTVVARDGDLATIRRFLHAWLALMSASIAVGLAYVAPTTGPQEGRFTWLSVHSVSAGSMLALSVPVAFGLFLAAGRRAMPWPRWVYGTLFAVQFVFLLSTRTRGSIGGALVAIAVMAWLSSGRRARPELVLGSLVAGGALALAFGRPVLEFLTRGETVDQIGTFNRRTEIWALAWTSFLERPVFGLGFNSAKGVFFDETGLGGAHNAVINVMIDVGLAGLIWWLALLGGAVALLVGLRRDARRSPVLLPGASGTAVSDHLVLIGLFTAAGVNGITTEGLGAGVNVSAIWLFVVVAWLTILDRSRRDNASARQRELTGEVRDRQLQTFS